ncbi:tyrosine-type recombinase/integrase [Arthrobacter sp. AOP36-C1-22]|uniref:tyrosine-type recombinase/integrase n=1 Tax=Arthrobacter sp. AOP36-C1-22 TaxID=3457683 RepID=UPI004033BD06
MGDPLKVRVSGPLAGLVPEFREELFRLGYAPGTVTHQLRFIAGLSRWLADREMGAAGLSESVVESFLLSWRRTHVNLRTARALRPFIDFVDAQGISREHDAPKPLSEADRLLAGFALHLTSERALRPATVRNYLNQAGPFIRRRAERSGEDFRSLTADEVSGFLLGLAGRQSIGSVSVAATAIRSLLRWMFMTGMTATRLDGAAGPVAYSSYSGLPKAISDTQLQDIRRQAGDCGAEALRNVALVAVLSRLGFRSGEAAALGIDDIDWRAGTITVPGKAGLPALMPLPADVGVGLADYLRAGRPATDDRHVFVRALAPHRFMTAGGISQIMTGLGVRAGISERIGAHRLRHTAATALMAAGGNLSEASQLLRHADRATTQIYAKVDLQSLRTMVVPWPTAAVAVSDPASGAQVSW